MVSIRIRIEPLKIKRYFKENLGTPFVICFQMLLLAYASFLIQGNSAFAYKIAAYASYLLVAGVILQLISFMRHQKEKDNDG